MSMYAEFCPNCAKTGKDVEEYINDLINNCKTSPDKVEQTRNFFQGYFSALMTNSSLKDTATKVCPYCGTKLIELPITKEEWIIISRAMASNYDYCYRDFLIELKKVILKNFKNVYSN